MVGVVHNWYSSKSTLIMNYNGQVVYDKFVKPDSKVTDFRTFVSGVKPYMLKE